MKILAIGNSFSDDATRYLHQIAKADGFDIKVINLYVPGCSLATHYKNMNNDAKLYGMRFNGIATGFNVSIKEALQSEEWDYVTLQQVSNKGIDYNTFEPYLYFLSDYVSYHCPCAAKALHQTWAYVDEEEVLKQFGLKNAKQMFELIKTAYETASERTGIKFVIPSGQAMENLKHNGIKHIHRDTLHASLGLGRYTLALTWYEFFTGNLIDNNNFEEFDELITKEEVAIAKKSAHDAICSCNY